MAALTRADFFKYSDDKNKDRKLKILEMYEDGKAFTLKDGTNVVFKFEKSVFDKIAGLKPGNNPKDKTAYASIVFTTKNNQRKKLTDLQKTKELGGGGSGSGGGAANTKLNESSVCLWCAVYKVYGSADFNTVVKNYSDKKVKALYDVDETDKNMISQKDETWIKHYERTASFLVKGMFSDGEYIFHRGGDFVDRIYKVFARVNKLMKIPFASANKWNPADIWVSKKGFDLPGIEDCQTIDCLNRYILNSLKDRNLVGVSLKKTLTSIRQTNFNVGEKRPPMVWTGYRVAAEGKGIFGSKDVYVYGKGEDDITMQVRSFDNLSGYQGEIIGAVAKYGKIAHGPINQVLNDLGLSTLPDQQIIVAKSKSKDEILIKDLYKMFSKYDEAGMNLESFIKTAKSSSTKADFLFSKYLGVKLIDILMSSTEKNRNSFVQGSIGYALSNTKNSSSFIKISQ